MANSSFSIVMDCKTMKVLYSYGTAQFILYTHVQARIRTHMCLHIQSVQNLKKLVCVCTVAHDFGVHTQDSKCTQHTRDTHHELALGLPHYTYGVTTGTVAVGNEIQLLFS